MRREDPVTTTTGHLQGLEVHVPPVVVHVLLEDVDTQRLVHVVAPVHVTVTGPVLSCMNLPLFRKHVVLPNEMVDP